MGKNFKGTLERGRRGAEQDGARGMWQNQSHPNGAV